MDKEVYERNLINKVIASIEKYGGKEHLLSIILTGSFGRDEPTYTVDSNGELQLKSDMEVALVFSKSTQKDAVATLIQKVTSEFTEDLNLMAINEKRIIKAYNFNYTLRVPKYKTIFTFDLFNGSKTIWGRDFIEKKKITLSDVDPYEAKRLVANRIGELTYLQNTADDDNKRYLMMQWKGKLILAIVSAWLICEKKYVSSYHGQYEIIKKDAEKAEKLLGNNFFEQYERVFRFLREDGEEYEVPDNLLFGYVANIDRYFKEQNIKTPKVNSLSRLLKYTVKYMKTGMKYGIIGFEDNLLQSLISDYCQNTSQLNTDAEVWHRVLY